MVRSWKKLTVESSKLKKPEISHQRLDIRTKDIEPGILNRKLSLRPQAAEEKSICADSWRDAPENDLTL
jgi:hypothetical protein